MGEIQVIKKTKNKMMLMNETKWDSRKQTKMEQDIFVAIRLLSS